MSLSAGSERGYSRRAMSESAALRPPLLQVEGVAVGENVEPQVEDRHRVLRLLLGNVRVGLAHRVHDIDGAGAAHREMTIAHGNPRVLVDADPEQPRILRDRADEPAQPAALGEVLIDEHATDEPE